MQTVTSRLVPFLFSFILIYALFKKVKVYDAFVDGAKKSIPLCVSTFPYLVAVFVMINLFKACGVADFLSNFLQPVLSTLGIPKELSSLILLKPFSGTASFATLSDIYGKYGVDSYISRCASVIYSSTDTVFYMSAIYFSKSSMKNILKPVLISLTCFIFSVFIACLLCKFI